METVFRASAKSLVHQPVLLHQVLQYLNIKPQRKFIDLTVGAGGHSQGIVQRGGLVLGLDVDPEILVVAKERLGDKAILKTSSYTHIEQVVSECGWQKVDGILLDLGLSSLQLNKPERGFSFRYDAPLDMRMDPTLGVTAADLINGLNVGELEELFTKLGEEKQARRVAKEIVSARSRQKITTTKQLAELVGKVKKGTSGKKIDPATLVFQALRIAVNDELNNLRDVLPKAVDTLNTGGRLVVISFHSLEDRIVKDFFTTRADLQILTAEPVVPTQEEINQNPRSRSARLRAVEKRVS